MGIIRNPMINPRRNFMPCAPQDKKVSIRFLRIVSRR
jgi:hypothetical protein